MNIINQKIKNYFKKNNKLFFYNSREERAEFIYKLFKPILKESILDVGCSKATLKNYLSNDIRYIGIDIMGQPDYIIDLEKVQLTQFEDNSFYTLICTEVLEHLNNLHEVFDELCRVSKKYIVISLPNNWLNFKNNLISGTGREHFYGLPVDIPKDRHKWFFSYEEAYNFIRKRGERNNFELKFTFPVPIIHNSFKHHIMNIFFKIYYKNKFGYNNLYYTSLWALLKKKA